MEHVIFSHAAAVLIAMVVGVFAIRILAKLLPVLFLMALIFVTVTDDVLRSIVAHLKGQ